MSDLSAPVVATAITGLATLLPGIDGNALIGAFAGAALFVTSARELSLPYRLMYLLISLIMGYLATPELIAHTFIKEPAVAGFIGGLLCVTVAEKLKELDISTFFKGLKK